jgi:uroporphyrinogen decarboxylase
MREFTDHWIADIRFRRKELILIIMNPRERLIASVNHRQPDRIPVDLGGTTVTGISAIAFNNLARHLGVAKPARILDVFQQLANVEMEIVDLLGVDVLTINRIFAEQGDWYEVELAVGSKAEFPSWYRPEKMPDGSWQAVDDEGKVLSRMIAGSSVFDQLFFPYVDGYPEDFSGFRDILKKLPAAVHSPGSDVNSAGMRNRAIALKNATGKAMTMSGGIGLLEIGNSARTMQKFLTDMLLNREKVSEMLDILMDINMEALEHLCSSLGDVADVICFGDDLGMKTGPLIDHDTFRKFFKPRYKILCDYVKSHSDLKIFFHSCGSIRQFIPDLIDSGFDILNPVQTDCRDMDPAVLKKEFGKDITLWGGGTETPSLANGTPEEIRDDVIRRCEILSKDGGFVFAPIHNIMPEVPPQNILAAYRAVQEFNGYIN